jgi:glutamine amidotransferase PdxT
MMADRASGMKEGGQPLLGGMAVEIHRNYFGSQAASFEAPLQIEDPVVREVVVPGAPGAAAANSSSSSIAAGGGGGGGPSAPSHFNGVFIRAPAILSIGAGVVPLAYVAKPKGNANVPDLRSPASSSSSSSSYSSTTTTTAASNEHSGNGVSSSAASPSTETAASSERVLVAARTEDFLVTAFHPELTESPGFHRLFARLVEGRSGKDLLGTVGAKSKGSIVPILPPSTTASAESAAGNKGSLLISRRVVPGTAPC